MEQKPASCPVSGQCGSVVVERAVLSSAPHLVMWGPRVPPVGGWPKELLGEFLIMVKISGFDSFLVR